VKLGLGTVQFGTDYGVSNKSGQTSPDEVSQILEFAADSGIRYLDTAPAYGNSESLLGQHLKSAHQFRIVTKTNKIGKSQIDCTDIDLVSATFYRSLQNLQQGSVYGLLVHHPDDLLAEGGEQLFEALKSLQTEGLVEKIGVSVYDQVQIEQLLDKYPIDLIQIPLNVFDQRLLKNAYLDSLATSGIEIHVRSVFLQGLLLMSGNELPTYLLDLVPHLASYRQANEERGISNLQAAIGFVDRIKPVNVSLVGVNDLNQLKEIVKANNPTLDLSYLDAYSLESEYLINPSLWRK
jgi:aryl-alcohol dehydrogenase-like predicted oxidoreductase